ncbi:MAG: M20/M25/M40 family metallo-hydrolase [Gemmatimonadales bacterium]
MSPRRTVPLLLALISPAALPGQEGTIRLAAESITQADVARRVGIIAHDSMGGRATASPGLLKTAKYVADEFRRLGLKPGGDSGTYLQNFSIVAKRVIAARSSASFGQSDGDAAVNATLAEGATWLGGASNATARGGVVMLGGAVNPDSLKAGDLKDKMVVYVLPAGNRSPTGYGRTMNTLLELEPAGVVVVTASDSLFGQWRQRSSRTSTSIGDQSGGIPVIAMLESTITGQVPEAAEQFAGIKTAPVTVVQPYPDWEGTITVRDSTVRSISSPNTVGILEGTDPTLKNEYLVFSAHMDHVGITGQPMAACGAMGGDSICNGADDDASGTAGVIELAEAYGRQGARPKRSLVFLTVSGEEQGLWGSGWFADHPPVPVGQIVANINMDMIGRNWKDTIAVIGKEHSDLGATLNRVNAEHRELNMTAIDDQWPAEDFYFRSDHFNFARKGVPILFFFSGVHADYHRPSDSPDKIDAEKEARILRLVYYLGLEVGNAAERPKWNPESYKRIVTGDR